MKTRTILFLAAALTAPFATMAACNGDNSNQMDGGPKNGDSGSDIQQQNDTGNPDTSNNDGGGCSTGLSFDNTLVPGWPNSIPQP